MTPPLGFILPTPQPPSQREGGYMGLGEGG